MLRAKLGSSAAQYDQAVESYNQTLLSSLQSVTAQIVTLRSTLSQQQDLKRGLELATRSFDLSQRGYKAGITAYINTARAQIILLQARQKLAANRAAYLDSWVQLMQALGGGLGDDLPVPEPDAPHIAAQPEKAATAVIQEAGSKAPATFAVQPANVIRQ